MKRILFIVALIISATTFTFAQSRQQAGQDRNTRNDQQSRNDQSRGNHGSYDNGGRSQNSHRTSHYTRRRSHHHSYQRN